MPTSTYRKAFYAGRSHFVTVEERGGDVLIGTAVLRAVKDDELAPARSKSGDPSRVILLVAVALLVVVYVTIRLLQGGPGW